MDIGISSAVFYPLYSENAIEKISNLGFKKAELFFNSEYEISEKFIEEMKRFLKEKDLKIISAHSYTVAEEGLYFFSGYKRREEEAMERYKSYFKNASKLGIKLFTIHGDKPARGKSSFGNLPTESHLNTLKRLSEAAAEFGITLCLENVSWCKSADPEYISAVSKALKNDITFTLDLKQARRAGVPIEKYIDAMDGKIKIAHISDCDMSHDCLLPGEGEFQFENFFKKLVTNGYNCEHVIEVYSTSFQTEQQILCAKKYIEGINC